ncbi:hypothetical protein [uncultured Tenacibaculum sp.]|uniref:hypothetical protein n=1 Tax=uncultured Tenacibaculum sp. TaxID=174713 RepID=UPI0026152C18|nr:hypothetical protein [uncultured Tenacibaculum sp.]
MKNKLLPQLFIIYTRYLIGFAFVFASLKKIQGRRFTTDSGAENPINTAWHFFETLYQSGLYWKFIGVGQLIAGLLLMTQRYSKLGAVVFFPVIANVFVITISYDFRGTPIITGLMLLANILLLIWDWDTLKVLVNKQPNFPDVNRLESDSIWTFMGFAFLLITLGTSFVNDGKDLLVVLIGILSVSIGGLILGIRRHKKRAIK